MSTAPPFPLANSPVFTSSPPSVSESGAALQIVQKPRPEVIKTLESFIFSQAVPAGSGRQTFANTTPFAAELLAFSLPQGVALGREPRNPDNEMFGKVSRLLANNEAIHQLNPSHEEMVRATRRAHLHLCSRVAIAELDDFIFNMATQTNSQLTFLLTHLRPPHRKETAYNYQLETYPKFDKRAIEDVSSLLQNAAIHSQPQWNESEEDAVARRMLFENVPDIVTLVPTHREIVRATHQAQNRLIRHPAFHYIRDHCV